MFEGNILQFGQMISLKDQSAFSFGYLFWKLEVLSFSFAQASLCISLSRERGGLVLVLLYLILHPVELRPRSVFEVELKLRKFDCQMGLA